MSGFITFKEFWDSRKFITKNDEGIEVYLNFGLADPYGIDDDAINDFVGVWEFMGQFHIECFAGMLSLVLENRCWGEDLEESDSSNEITLFQLAEILYFEHAIAYVNGDDYEHYCGWCGAKTRCVHDPIVKEYGKEDQEGKMFPGETVYLCDSPTGCGFVSDNNPWDVISEAMEAIEDYSDKHFQHTTADRLIARQALILLESKLVDEQYRHTAYGNTLVEDRLRDIASGDAKPKDFGIGFISLIQEAFQIVTQQHYIHCTLVQWGKITDVIESNSWDYRSIFFPTKNMTDWLNCVRSPEPEVEESFSHHPNATKFVGKTVQRIRFLTDAENESFGFYQIPVVIEFTDGSFMIPQSDCEGNDGGSLYAQDANGRQTVIYSASHAV